MRISATTISIGLTGCLALAAAGISPASPMHHAKVKHPTKATATSKAEIAKGKTLIASLRCNTCHGADLKGKKGFSPSLRPTGPIRHYNSATWARLLNVGLDEKGKPVHKPMPTFHLDKPKSAAIYAYLKTLK